MRNFIQRVKNFFFWGWKLRNDVNWDYSSVYKVLELKLTQLRNGCYQNGHHVWSEKSREYRALSECIHLCKVLREDYSVNLSQIDMSKVGFFAGKFSNRMSPQEDKFFRNAVKKDEEVQKHRKERLHFLLNKWSDFWWD